MNKRLPIFILVFLFIGFVSAYSNYNNHYSYSNQGFYNGAIHLNEIQNGYYLVPDYSPVNNYNYFNEKISLNENRYPIYDYYWGYTYRTTDEFGADYSRKVIQLNKHSNYDYQTSNSNYYFQRNNINNEMDFYYKYQPLRGSYEKIDCYSSHPKDQIFYRRCPSTILLN